MMGIRRLLRNECQYVGKKKKIRAVGASRVSRDIVPLHRTLNKTSLVLAISGQE